MQHKQSPKELDDKKKLATVALDFFGDNQDKNTTKQEIKVLNHGFLLKKRKQDQIDGEFTAFKITMTMTMHAFNNMVTFDYII